MPRFRRYFGVDYSGAGTPEQPLDGLRIFTATPDEEPREIFPAAGRSRRWSRRGLAEWLAECLRSQKSAIVGIDHAFSFPWAYFVRYGLPPDWFFFLEDFCQHWPTDSAGTRVSDLRQRHKNNLPHRLGEARWRRPTDVRCGAKSVFHFDVPGSVAASTHAGLPWLRYWHRALGHALHFWPFEGWTPRSHASVVAEVYPSLWQQHYPRLYSNPHQQDAYCIVRWLQENDAADGLEAALHPVLSAAEVAQAQTEGWILGGL